MSTQASQLRPGQRQPAKRFHSGRLFALTFAAAILSTPVPAHADCAAPSGLCVRSGDGVGWKPGEKLSDKQRTREAKKNKKRDPVIMYFDVTGGRGSVFIDGSYAGTAPLQAFELKPGKHDVQVRDGARVLTAGVLVVPREPNGDVQVEVQYR